MVEAAHLTISGLDPHKIPHFSRLGMVRSSISLVEKNKYLDAKYNEISSCHLDGIEDDDKKGRLKKKLMERNEVRRDLLDVIDVPDLTEDERQAMKKLRKDKRKPRKDKGTKRKRPLRDMASKLIELIEAVENVSTVVYDTYPQVVVKVKDFITRDGVTQATMCKVLGGIYPEKLNLFLSGENANKCGKTYKAAYLFFEKFRILEENDKSEDRVKNER